MATEKAIPVLETDVDSAVPGNVGHILLWLATQRWAQIASIADLETMRVELARRGTAWNVKIFMVSFMVSETSKTEAEGKKEGT